jgi:hypothetical protein
MNLKSKQQQTNLETIRELLTTMFCPNIPLLAKLKLALGFLKYLNHFLCTNVLLLYIHLFSPSLSTKDDGGCPNGQMVLSTIEQQNYNC